MVKLSLTMLFLISMLGQVSLAYEYGIDRLSEPEISKKLENKSIAVLAHAASVNRSGEHLIDLIHSRFLLKRIFAPEHGLRSLDDDFILDGKDEKTGLPIISLYKKQSRAPSPDDLKDIDVILIDLQDVGVRYYTYFSTVAECLKVAAMLGKEVFILDRPNPLGGVRVEGEVLEPELSGHFISYHTIPTRHGMTLGELARLYVHERLSTMAKPSFKLEIIDVKGWNREAITDESERRWVPSSPALLTLDQVRLYALWGSLEHFNVAVGRGQTNDLAFKVIAAPWMSVTESETLAARLNSLSITGMVFLPHQYRVSRAVYQGQVVNGVMIHGKLGDESIRTDQFTYEASVLLSQLFPGRIVFSAYASRYYGHRSWVESILQNRSWFEMLSRLDLEIAAFLARRQPFLLY